MNLEKLFVYVIEEIGGDIVEVERENGELDPVLIVTCGY
jgi:hypothetical protein